MVKAISKITKFTIIKHLNKYIYKQFFDYEYNKFNTFDSK